MASTLAEEEEVVVKDFSGLFRVYKDGRVERYNKYSCFYIPPSDNATTGVRSKDHIDKKNNIAARRYLPKLTEKSQRFPLLIYIHGGVFSIGSAFTYDKYQHGLVANANMVTVSVDYSLAPEHPLPKCFDDSWAVIKWAASHMKAAPHQEEFVKEPWLMDHVDFSRVFLVGDSAGASIVHEMVVRASASPLGDGFRILGMALMHPFFGDNRPDEYLSYVYPGYTVDNPILNSAVHPGLLTGLICPRILVFTAELDALRDRAWAYYEAVRKSEWKGEVEIMETQGEGHIFFVLNPDCEKAVTLMKRLVDFFNYNI